MASRFLHVGADRETARTSFIKGSKTVLKPHVILKAPVPIQEAEKCALEAEQLYALNKVAIQETCQEMLNQKKNISCASPSKNIDLTEQLAMLSEKLVNTLNQMDK